MFLRTLSSGPSHASSLLCLWTSTEACAQLPAACTWHHCKCTCWPLRNLARGIFLQLKHVTELLTGSTVIPPKGSWAFTHTQRFRYSRRKAENRNYCSAYRRTEDFGRGTLAKWSILILGEALRWGPRSHSYRPLSLCFPDHA